MNEATVSLEAPFVKDFQQASTFKLNDRIPVKVKRVGCWFYQKGNSLQPNQSSSRVMITLFGSSSRIL